MKRVWCVCVVFLALISGLLGLKFLIVTHDGVRLYTVDGRHQKVMILKDMVKDMDYHLERDELYALTYRQILRTPLDGRPRLNYEPLVDPEDEYRLTSLAVDWVHNTLYWTSGAVFILHRAHLNGSEPKVIFRGCYIEKNLNRLVVDPYVGILLWMTNNEVHSADLRGKNHQKNVFPGISSVRDIALDPSRQRIYFLAAFSGGDNWWIASSNYDGSELRRHVGCPRVAYGLGGHAGDVYWIPHEEDCCTWEGGDQYRLSFNLYTAKTEDTARAQQLLKFSETVWNLRVCHPDLQMPKQNDSSLRTSD